MDTAGRSLFPADIAASRLPEGPGLVVVFIRGGPGRLLVLGRTKSPGVTVAAVREPAELVPLKQGESNMDCGSPPHR